MASKIHFESPNPKKIVVTPPKSKSAPYFPQSQSNTPAIKIEKPKTQISVEKPVSNSFHIVDITKPGKSKEGEETCPICKEFSSQYYDLLEHIVDCHGFSETIISTFAKKKSNELYSCNACQIILRSAKDVIIHFIYNHTTQILTLIRDNSSQRYASQFNEINTFIEKHDPSIVVNFQRNYAISSSSDDEPLPQNHNEEQEEYLNFVASSINFQGISVTNNRSFSIAPSSIENNNNQTPIAYIERLNLHETFLRKYHLISFSDDGCFCKICHKKFSTSISLMTHCWEEHKLTITPELRRILMIMSSKIDKNATLEELIKTNIRLDFTLYPISSEPPTSLSHSVMKVPALLTDFLIESLCPNPPYKHMSPKYFEASIMLNLPSPLPVIIEPSNRPNEMRIGFVSSALANEDEEREIIQGVLGNLSKKPFVTANIEGVSLEGFSDEDLDQLAKKTESVVLKTEDQKCPDEMVNGLSHRKFNIYVMPINNNMNEKDYQKIKDEIAELYNERKLMVCKKCRVAYDEKIGGDCSTSKLGKLKLNLQGKHEKDTIHPIASCTFQVNSLF